MTVQIEEQQRTLIGVRAGIKFSAVLVITDFVVIFWREEPLRIADKVRRARFNNVVEIDQVTVNIGKMIAIKFSVQKHRTCTNKWLDQTVALRQMAMDLFY